MQTPINLNGGLTLVPMEGFEGVAERIREKIENLSPRKYKSTEVDIAETLFALRGSGEPYIQLKKKHIGGHDCVVLTSGPGTYEMLGKLWLLLATLKGRRARRITVVSGYYPLSRSDKDEGELELALVRVITDITMAASYGKLDRIIAVDLHSDQVVNAGPPGVITQVSTVRRLLQKAVSDAQKEDRRLVLCYPDDSAGKRVEKAVADTEGQFGVVLPSVFGSKRRHSDTEQELKGLFGDMDALPGSTVLMIDDEIASGGTANSSARALVEHHDVREVRGAMTHPVLTPGAYGLLGTEDCFIKRTYVADTIPLDNRRQARGLIELGHLVEVTWQDDLAWIVYHHHWDNSVRESR